MVTDSHNNLPRMQWEQASECTWFSFFPYISLHFRSFSVDCKTKWVTDLWYIQKRFTDYDQLSAKTWLHRSSLRQNLVLIRQVVNGSRGRKRKHWDLWQYASDFVIYANCLKMFEVWLTWQFQVVSCDSLKLGLVWQFEVRTCVTVWS